MEKRTIAVKPTCFAPEFEMMIQVPNERDAEEYIIIMNPTRSGVRSSRRSAFIPTIPS